MAREIKSSNGSSSEGVGGSVSIINGKKDRFPVDKKKPAKKKK